LEHVGW